MSNIQKLAQKNLDHYNDNPTKHVAQTTAFVAGAVVVFGMILRRVVKDDLKYRSGQYAK